MELTEWQKAFKEYFEQKFSIAGNHLHHSVQAFEENAPLECLRYDMVGGYPWPLFERFVRELPEDIQVQVVQQVDVTGFNFSYKESQFPTELDPSYDLNFETKITTRFLFFKVS
jgi:hypothetical protein